MLNGVDGLSFLDMPFYPEGISVYLWNKLKSYDIQRSPYFWMGLNLRAAQLHENFIEERNTSDYSLNPQIEY